MNPSKISRYEVIAELGRGGMATVYHAHDPQFGREVAIKVLPREFLHDRTFRERFRREAQTIAALEHSAIVPVYDFDEHEGQPFFVMRYMPGGSLADKIREGPLSLEEASMILSRIGDALDRAHGEGIIHRDIKPANILFNRYGEPGISDFGIVKLTEATAQLTGSGIVGTPTYMAPEMTEAGSLTSLIDVYALGVTLYQMLTGQVPYDAPTPMGILMSHMGKPVPDARELRPDLSDAAQAVIERAMAKDPMERYQSAGELAAALAAVVAGEAAEVAPPPQVEVARPEESDALTEAIAAPEKGTYATVPAPPIEVTEQDTVQEAERPAARDTRRDAAREAVRPIPSPLPRRRAISPLVWIPGLPGVIIALVVMAAIILLVVTEPWNLLFKPATPATEAPAEAEPTEPPAEAPAGPVRTGLGSEGEPIVWLVEPFGTTGEAQAAAEGLAVMLHEQTGLHFTILIADSSSRVIEVLCSNEAQIGTLSAIPYVAASQTCEVEAKLVGIRFDSTTTQGLFLTHINSGIESLADLPGTVFCRANPASVSGWILPYMQMRLAGLDPDSDLAEIVDTGTHDNVVLGIYDGTCHVGATYVDARDSVEVNYPDVMDVVIDFDYTVEIPQSGVQFNSTLSHDLRVQIAEALLIIADTEPGWEMLMAIQGWEGLEWTDDSVYLSLRELIEASGTDAWDYVR